VFHETNQLNQAFLLVADMVTCYRAELGGMLRKLVESYNSVILQQFESFYRAENELERELLSKIGHHEHAREELASKRAEFELKLEQAKAIVSSKDALIESMQKNEELLELEIVDLREQALYFQEAARQATELAMAKSQSVPDQPQQPQPTKDKVTIKQV
jgi:hypothetical protein